jgi:hypothetical protein
MTLKGSGVMVWEIVYSIKRHFYFINITQEAIQLQILILKIIIQTILHKIHLVQALLTITIIVIMDKIMIFNYLNLMLHSAISKLYQRNLLKIKKNNNEKSKINKIRNS